ncbi:MAG: peptide ABC transporter substrate-binding protein [Ktedonobacteraceae bacterium]|nr:peptide ABC transporter substrate-binding protein [Ktedonobacteraceae bacterium]
MHYHSQSGHTRHLLLVFSLLGALLMLLSSCSSTTASSPANNKKMLLPNVGINDIGTLDPAVGPDANSALAVNMIYSGLVRTDQNLKVIPDQATWLLSNDNKVYTFQINPAVTFSDGTPVTAQSYIYSWTRALLPEVASPDAASLEAPIAGASAVSNGKATSIKGLKALDAHTLQVTLIQPAPYFLATLTNSLFFPLNQKVIERYGQKNWTEYAATAGVGTGPFKVKTWEHDVQMILTPNPYYYGKKTALAEVDMIFVNDPSTAYQFYRAGRFTFMWNIAAADLPAAKGLSGFIQTPLLQTDMLFFDTTQPPFNNATVRQAFAYATDKATLADTTFKNSVVPAATLLPPGIPGYQANYAGIQFDRQKAKDLFQSVYPPNASTAPSITFSYPNSLMNSIEAQALLQMWQSALQIPIAVRPVETNAYFAEAQKHLIQFGFTQWNAHFPDPYALMATHSLSTENQGQWTNSTFDQTVLQAEQASGNTRLALYAQAEQLAIKDAGWLPLDHPQLSAVIPPNVHGVSLNGNGLYFGDWSDVYLS